MKIHIIILILLFTACSVHYPDNSVSHMRKSQDITAILENMSDIDYDESYSEIDRDKLRLRLAKDYYHEVTVLNKMLKNNTKRLPNQEALLPHQLSDYQKIIKLLDANLKYLHQTITSQKNHLILPAIKSTALSCKACHTLFKNNL